MASGSTVFSLNEIWHLVQKLDKTSYRFPYFTVKKGFSVIGNYFYLPANKSVLLLNSNSYFALLYFKYFYYEKRHNILNKIVHCLGFIF